MTPSIKPAAARASDAPGLQIEHDALGRAVRVFIGPLDITHLVARVGTNTTMLGTRVEVVLSANVPALDEPFPALADQPARAQ